MIARSTKKRAGQTRTMLPFDERLEKVWLRGLMAGALGALGGEGRAEEGYFDQCWVA